MITIENMKFYTVQEIATALNVTPQTVRAWIKQGKLKSQRIGRPVLIKQSSLMEFLDANK
jgi:excisionase family DNA binding protein